MAPASPPPAVSPIAGEPARSRTSSWSQFVFTNSGSPHFELQSLLRCVHQESLEPTELQLPPHDTAVFEGPPPNMRLFELMMAPDAGSGWKSSTDRVHDVVSVV